MMCVSVCLCLILAKWLNIAVDLYNCKTYIDWSKYLLDAGIFEFIGMKMMYLPLLFLFDDLVLFVLKKYHISSPNYSLYTLLTHQKGGERFYLVEIGHARPMSNMSMRISDS